MKFITQNMVLKASTRAMGHFLQVGDVTYGGQKVYNAIGPDQPRLVR